MLKKKYGYVAYLPISSWLLQREKLSFQFEFSLKLEPLSISKVSKYLQNKIRIILINILINHSYSQHDNAVIILTAMPGLQKSVICCMPHSSTQSNCKQDINNSVCFLSYIQRKLAKYHSVAFERKMNTVNFDQINAHGVYLL